MNNLKIFGLCSVFISLTACASASGPINGQVLELATKTPIANAHVFLDWAGEVSGWADTQSVCIHAESTVSDQQGRFKTPAWSEETKHGGRMRSSVPTIEPYKPGYVVSYSSDEWAKAYKKGILLMEPYKGTNQERLQYLLDLSNRVQCFGTDQKSLFQMRRAIYQEAKSLAVSDQDKHTVQGIRYNAVSIWLQRENSLDPREIDELIRNDDYLREQLK